MEKEQALDQFLKTLRISLNYISLYSHTHRSFLGSVERLMHDIDQLFLCLEPVEIGFTPDSLIVGGQVYAKLLLHKELAHIFHARKIKSITFSRGITARELTLILSKVALPVKEVLKGGGLGQLLARENLPHFSQEELDYSHLLREDGEETPDVWAFLLKSPLEGEDQHKIDEFIDTFETMLPRIKARHLLEDEKLRENVHKMLLYVKQKGGERFLSCSRELLRALLKDKSVSSDPRIDSLKPMFADLGIEELSSILWDGISSDEHFDNMSLELFSRLVGQEKHEGIADMLVKHAGKEKNSGIDPGRVRRMKSIFSLSQPESYIPSIYREALLRISEEGFFDRGFSFDRQKLQANYDFILLYLLKAEKEAKARELILKKLLALWGRLTSRIDGRFFLALNDVVAGIPADAKGAEGELLLKFQQFLEDGAWQADFPEELKGLAQAIKTSALGPETYLRRFFRSGQYTAVAIQLYFRLFPSRAGDFYAGLESRMGDFEFMNGIIECVKGLEPRVAMDALEGIFAVSNGLVKVNVIQAMGKLPLVDHDFLLLQIKEGDYFLKKEALSILIRDGRELSKALQLFLLESNPWGEKNDLLVENLSIVEEVNCRAARPHLQQLARKNIIFYWKVRKRARAILERWNA